MDSIVIGPALFPVEALAFERLRYAFFERHGMRWYETPESKTLWVARSHGRVVAGLAFHDYTDQGLRWVDDFYGVPGHAKAFSLLGRAVRAEAHVQGLRLAGYVHPRATTLQRIIRRLGVVPVAQVYCEQEFAKEESLCPPLSLSR